jgi:hypothetical protein
MAISKTDVINTLNAFYEQTVYTEFNKLSYTEVQLALLLISANRTTGTTPTPVPTPTVILSNTIPSSVIVGTTVSLLANVTISNDTVVTQFKINGTNLSTAISGNTPTVNWTPNTPGDYTITAVSTGSQGGTATSASKTITITAAPVNYSKYFGQMWSNNYFSQMFV